MSSRLPRCGARRMSASSALHCALLALCGSGLALAGGAPPGAADPQPSGDALRFRVHVVDADSTYSPCAAFDVDDDGRIDIVGGGAWFQAPDWKRHVLREVELIRGRYDDYSNLPVDVNGDGRTDLVAANYRSSTLYWFEHPGGDGTALWKTHVVEKPGPMETGRLHDVDGDGRLDVLPNGTSFAGWYSFAPGPAGPKWTRHPLPDELAAHGVGFGDVDGDGRGDVVGRNGWARAPADRRQGRWVFHPEFALHRDASVPILVEDVDGDGDNDIVWGRGHGIGVYWFEQLRTPGAKDGAGRSWRLHAVDTSLSQQHSPLWADLDGDGRAELVTGSRYLPHDGNDIGEFDPLVVAAYDFLPASRTFRRRTLVAGWRVGFGLDPKAVDLDGDGDLDLVCPGRSGLYRLENMRIDRAATSANAPSASNPQRDAVPWLTRPLPESGDPLPGLETTRFRDASGAPQPIASRFDWGHRRTEVLAGMEAVMGPLPGPDRRVPLDVRTTDTVRTDKYERRSISFAVEPGDRVPAYLLVPHGLDRPAPAMLCLHQTTKIGKGEPAGLGGLPTLHYARELAERGYVCLVPDYPSFGDYPFDFAAARDRWTSGSLKAVWNNLRAVDLLESLPEVDRDAIGAIGHSLGGHNSLFTAAFDQRIRAVVTSCGFTPFHDYYGGKLAGWTSDRYMPRIRDVYGNDPDKVPFDFPGILLAIAPRAVFVSAPTGDSNFDVAGVKRAVAAAGPAWQLFGRADRLTAVHPEAGHLFPDDVRRQSYDWLDRVLRRKGP